MLVEMVIKSSKLHISFSRAIMEGNKGKDTCQQTPMLEWKILSGKIQICAQL